MVKYCNAACKKKHRHKHKKECEEHVRLAAERAAELHDEKLFEEPPKPEDCPICFLHMPIKTSGSTYFACSGKVICSGCVYAPVYDNQGNLVAEKKCPFCRTPAPTPEENVKGLEKRVEAGDAEATFHLGLFYRDEMFGFPRDYTKALELFHRAGELGYSMAYNNIGYTYNNGIGVEVDQKKAIHYWELGVLGGCEKARYNLGCNEAKAGNIDRALKHWMNAARNGQSESLEVIKHMYSKESLEGHINPSGKPHVTKDYFMEALQLYQVYLGGIKSDQRDEAASANNKRYY